MDKSKVDIIEDNEEIQNESTKKVTEITPISPDLENYSLLDKNKVEIIEKQRKNRTKGVIKTTEEIMNEHLYNETQPEENFTEEKIIKQDLWLHKDYMGKP